MMSKQRSDSYEWLVIYVCIYIFKNNLKLSWETVPKSSESFSMLKWLSELMKREKNFNEE